MEVLSYCMSHAVWSLFSACLYGKSLPPHPHFLPHSTWCPCLKYHVDSVHFTIVWEHETFRWLIQKVMGVPHQFLLMWGQSQKILEDELVGIADISTGRWRLTVTSFYLGLDLEKSRGAHTCLYCDFSPFKHVQSDCLWIEMDRKSLTDFNQKLNFKNPKYPLGQL